VTHYLITHGTLLQELDSSDKNEAFEKAPGSTTLNDAAPAWSKDFNLYLNTTDEIPERQTLIQWWGVSYELMVNEQINAHRYPVWASLARDYLAIMSSSVFSERAFSSASWHQFQSAATVSRAITYVLSKSCELICVYLLLCVYIYCVPFSRAYCQFYC
jgi:hypothetical protein